MPITFHALPTADVLRIKSTQQDAYGLAWTESISTGSGTPCRHCLCDVPKGMPYLILAHRPFKAIHAYAETGPIFLCKTNCQRAPETGHLPAMLTSPQYILRAYTEDERIAYGTGSVVQTPAIARRAAALLETPEHAFVDIRSAANNCFQCRIHRA